MSLDVGLSLPGDNAARQGSWTVTPLHAVVAVFLVAIMLRGLLPFNVDVSWWLIVCERMLDGQRLYVDILRPIRRWRDRSICSGSSWRARSTRGRKW